jgi:hypothetical protein
MEKINRYVDIRETIPYDGSDEFTETEVLELFKLAKEKGYKNVTINALDYYFEICGDRLETDQEFESRKIALGRLSDRVIL